MRWSDDGTQLTLGGVSFHTIGEPESQHEELKRVLGLGALTPTVDRFPLLKTRPMVQRYVELVEALRPSKVVDLGIFAGGSVALLASLTDTTRSRVVAIDKSPERVAGLDELIEARGWADRVRPFYDVDQADVATLRALIDAEFGTAPLDLVIDDCSHRWEPTLASFEVLFPRLRPDGVYVIEDWSWGVVPLATPELTDRLRTLPARPLATIVMELALTCATRPGVLTSVEICGEVLVLRRGPAELDDDFRLQGCRWDEVTIDVALGPRP